MGLLSRIRHRHRNDLLLEARYRIRRNQDQTYSQDDVQRLTEERAPWMKKKRRG